MPKSTFIRFLIFSILYIIMNSFPLFSQDVNHYYTYAIVISEATYNDSEWRKVADALLEKHDVYGQDKVKLFKWENSITEVKNQLSEFMPHYIGFVAQPVVECNEPNIDEMYEMCRTLDSDPYGDAVWGVITGYEAADALRAVKNTVVMKTLISGNGNEEEWDALQGIGFLEEKPGNTVRYKFSDGEVIQETVNPDFDVSRVTNISNLLNNGLDIKVDGHPDLKGDVDLLTTSGHGGKTVWMASNGEGMIDSYDGKLIGKPTGGADIPINSPNPKCYSAHGNCEVGNPDNINNMVYAFFHSGGCINMIGYIPTTYFGYIGWGFLDRLRDFKGYYTYPETFFITNQCLYYDIANNGDPVGKSMTNLLYDKDTTILYGDPKSDARLFCIDSLLRPYGQELQHIKTAESVPDTFVYTLTCNMDLSFSWWNGFVGIRPFHFLPARLNAASVNIESNDGVDAVITDNFLLFEAWVMADSPKKGDTKSIRWTSKVTEYYPDPNVGIDNPNSASVKISKKNHIKVTSNMIEFTAPGKNKYSIDIVNISGKRIRTIHNNVNCKEGLNQISWDSNSLASGMYIIRIIGNNIINSQKIVLEK